LRAQLLVPVSGAQISPSLPKPHLSQASSDALMGHYDAARKLQVAGKQEQAVAEYKEFLAEALRRIANASAHSGDFEGAVEFFEEALSFSPKAADLYLDYSAIRVQQAKLPQARALAEKALQLAPNDTAAHSALGRILFHQGDYQAAKEHLEKATAAAANFDNGYTLGMTYVRLNDLNRAALLFQEMATGLGDTAQIHLYFARAYRDGQQFDQAIEELKKAAAKDTRLPQVHYFQGLAHLERDGESGFPAAVPELRAELKNNPEDARTHYLLGYILVRQHNLGEAEVEFVRAAELDPQNPDPFIYLGQVYLETSRLKEAENAARKAIALTKDVSRNGYQLNRSHYVLARVMLTTGRPEEAAKEMALSEELRNRLSRPELAGKEKFPDSPNLPGEEEPNRPGSSATSISAEERGNLEAYKNQLKPALADAYNNLGVAAAARNDFASAYALFQKASGWNPSLETLDRNLGMAAFYGGQYAQAVAPLERHLRDRADDTRVRAALGLSFFDLKNYPKVLATLQPIETEAKTDPGLAYAFAVSLIKTGDYTRGVDRLKQLEKVSPNSADIHLILGDAFADQGVYPTALEEFRKALAIEPNQARTHFLIGLALIHQGNPAEATSELRTALKLDPSDLKTRYHLAFALLQVQQKEEARALLQEIIQQDPKNADAYYQLGKLQLEQGETRAAISNLEMGTKISPDSDYVHYQLSLAYRRDSRAEDAEREMKLYQALKDRHRGRSGPQSN
jgi:tetratricopeptide (TPR) repeat protein